jgi:type IV pilus assembly protein PilE
MTPKPTDRAHRNRGFSLIELLTVLLIVALLSSVAWPSYRAHVQRAQRTQAAAALMQAQQFMERHFSLQGSFLDKAGEQLQLPAAVQSVGSDGQVTYRLQIEQSDASSYRLRADPEGAMVDDPCAALTLDHLSQKGRTGSGLTVDECWR